MEESSRYPIAIGIADTHLGEDTIQQNISVFAQVFKLCHELNVSTILHLGDIFTSRKGQPEIVLNTFKNILDSIHANGLSMIAIPGNHDKQSYVSDSSLLDAFDGHPAFNVATIDTLLDLAEVRFHFCPYYDEQLLYKEKLKVVCDKEQSEQIALLLTHCAIDGVVNNAGIQMVDEIPIKLFSQFHKVFVGHYHNRQQFANIVYTGSTDPRNFGENELKGCTIFYSDGTYQLFDFEFQPYITINLLAKDLTPEILKQAKQKSGEANLRFKIEGQISEQLKPFIAQLHNDGIKVELHKEVLIGSSPEMVTKETIQMSGVDIIKTYDEWSEDRKIEDKEFGRKLLIQK